METFEGLLIDTYVLQEQPMMLTGINLQLEDRVINGLLKDRYLAKYILRLPLNKYVLEVSGKWNRRNQLVIKKMLRCYTSFRNQLKKCKTQIKGEILL
ncbi:hypothetical protein EfmAA610_13330 [Enterococcus faecium]|nr:hypothetical protein EfmAA610_13330 [Enterococcus faecium]